MDNELRKKLSAIQGLMDRAGTVAEAESAAAAFQRMIIKHNLKLEELEGLGRKDHEDYLSKYVVLGAKGTTGLQWRINLAYAVAQMNFCAFIREGVHGGTGWIVGQASNVDAAEQMFKTIVDANERLAPLEWSAFRNTPEGAFTNATAWKKLFQNRIRYGYLSENADGATETLPGAGGRSGFQSGGCQGRRVAAGGL